MRRIPVLGSALLALALALATRAAGGGISTAAAPFPNFESGPVNALLVAGDRLLALNTSDHRVEVYRIGAVAAKQPAKGGAGSSAPLGGLGGGGGGAPPIGAASARARARLLAWEGSVFTGLEPVAMALDPANADRLFVCNHLSDTVAVVDLDILQVVATVPVGDEPQGLAVAAGTVFVACARAELAPLAPGGLEPGPFQNNVVAAFQSAPPYALLPPIAIPGLKPRDLATAGAGVFVIPQNSGNHTTLLNENHTVALALPQTAADALDPPFLVNPVLTRPELNPLNVVRGWYVPIAGRIVLDAEYPTLVAALADADAIEIDASTRTPTGTVAHGLGTTLLDVEQNPLTGDLWIAGTDARNRTRFEPNLRGAALSNRVAVAGANGALKSVLELAPPLLPAPLAQPAVLAFDAAGGSAFVAGLGSAAVVALDAATGQFRATLAVGAVPSGLAVHSARRLLFVYSRGEHSIAAFDLADAFEPLGEPEPLPFDPEPAAVREGRPHLYDATAAAGHGNGTMSCASCHVFGHDDQLAWDLGDPMGSFAYYYPEVLTGLLSYPGAVVASTSTPVNHPLKGPMVTQSLRGLLDPLAKDDLPLHWRGDRRALQQFRPAFANLLGGTGIGAAAIQEFATFVRYLRYPPNPFEAKDRTYSGFLGAGADKYGMNPQFDGKEFAAGTGVSCIDCHQGDFFAFDDFTGSRPVASAGSFTQLFQTAQLRLAYEKDFRDLAGFGLLHDGAVDGVRGFMDFNVPNGGPPTFANLTAEDKDQVASFVKAWDTGTSPLVGAQFTLDAASVGQVDAFLDLAEAQAMPPFAHVDLILKGFRVAPDGAILPRGAVFAAPAGGSGPWGYQFDTGTVADRALMKAFAAAGLATFTFSCVPPGMGQRLGVDRDEDGLLDLAEAGLGTLATRPDSDGDGYSDGFEVGAGSNPLHADAFVADALPPAISGARALEVFHDAATISFLTSEPAAVRVDCGSAPGLADLASASPAGLRRIHDVPVLLLPGGTTVHFRVTATDKNGNAAAVDGNFTTLPPFFHVAEVTLAKSGTGPYEVTGRVRVVDARGAPVPGIPVTVFFAGDIGGQNWQRVATTAGDGVATFALAPYTPAAPTAVWMSPAYVGSLDPGHPYFVGAGGTTPSFFYAQEENAANAASLQVP